jgi:hypothetical protein
MYLLHNNNTKEKQNESYDSETFEKYCGRKKKKLNGK